MAWTAPLLHLSSSLYSYGSLFRLLLFLKQHCFILKSALPSILYLPLSVGFSQIVRVYSPVISPTQMTRPPSVCASLYPSIPAAYKHGSGIPPAPSAKASALWRVGAIVVSDKASLSVE